MGCAMIQSIWSPRRTSEVSTGLPELASSNQSRPRAVKLVPGLLEASTFPSASVIWTRA
jgi:hypothetical protein